jgi:hypothetical protein
MAGTLDPQASCRDAPKLVVHQRRQTIECPRRVLVPVDQNAWMSWFDGTELRFCPLAARF